MRPVTVEIISWKKTLLATTILAFVHPIAVLSVELLQGKTLRQSLFDFAIYLVIYLTLDLLFLLRFFFAGQIRHIRADAGGLHFKKGFQTRFFAWSQIASLERCLVTEKKVPKNTLILRDAGGQELTRVCREIYETPLLYDQFAELEAFIIYQIGGRGVIEAPLEAVTQTQFAFKTGYKALGLGSLVLWLPCAFFSWNHPTGGALVGAGFLGMAALGIFLALCDSRYEVDERGVRAQTLFKKRELRWEEIRRAEMLRGMLSIHFKTEKGGLDILGPPSWGKDGALLMRFLQAQFDRFGIVWQSDKAPQWRDFFVSPDKRA